MSGHGPFDCIPSGWTPEEKRDLEKAATPLSAEESAQVAALLERSRGILEGLEEKE